MSPWECVDGRPIRCLRCLDTLWVADGRGGTLPCPDCQPGAAVLALKRGSRR